MAQNKTNQYLVDYSRELKQLNEIELQVPQAKIDTVLKDPKQYALDFLELSIAKYVKSYKKAHELGKILATKNLNGKES